MQIRTGNIFDADAVPVIPVNIVGVMGAGLAKETAERYPLVERSYKSACRAHYMRTGKVTFVHIPELSFALFPTKHYWSNPSQIEWIASGLRDLQQKVLSYGFTAIAFPKLGCGLGGLDRNEVKPLIERTASFLEAHGVEVFIFVDQSDLT